MYHLACLEPPFNGDNLINLGNSIANKKPKQIPHVFSNKFITFVDQLLNKNPRLRPSAVEALQSIPTFVAKSKSGEGLYPVLIY